jgi:hypothetical protein
MKKLAVVLFAFACSALISYNESDRYYSMIAHLAKVNPGMWKDIWIAGSAEKVI